MSFSDPPRHRGFPPPPPSRLPEPPATHRWHAAPLDGQSFGAGRPDTAWADAARPDADRPAATRPGDGLPGGGPGDDGLPRLRSAYRLLRRATTLTALGYFVLFLLLSAYAPDLMATSLPGGTNLGLLMGFLQLPVAMVAVVHYERLARRNVDPLADHVRAAATPADPVPSAGSRTAPWGGVR
ncbi:DUF485 domain-containing protein [Streptomyces sp. 549]|uniref:DUF485 domain-containing protein n=1 Tax=Streptomyces sp. 549 TaxID=3049076 RepID=UPI0024C44A9A|nr:DUF485 domain-containing protein [Streptomyces sp. 549]MDK1475988.1 DUF485 domain-containing protein [Streptomyces sp. 549]